MASRIHFYFKNICSFLKFHSVGIYKKKAKKKNPALNRQTGQLERMTSVSLLLTILITLRTWGT